MRKTLFSCVLLAIAWLGFGTAWGEDLLIDRLAPPAIDGRDLPFSTAVRVDHTVYFSGQIGNVPGKMALVHGGIKAETRQAIENIKAVLKQHGSSLDRIAKCTVFLADINEWAQMNEVYREYFADAYPARSAIGVGGLALGARVELECIAIAKDGG